MVKNHVILIDSDRVYLEGLTRSGSLKARELNRILGLLQLDSGKTYQEVSSFLGVSYQTVSAWSKHYKAYGLKAIHDKSRSGRPSKFSDLDTAKVTALACSDAPEGYSQWSLRLLADKLVELEYIENISYSTVGQILKKRTSAAS